MARVRKNLRLAAVVVALTGMILVAGSAHAQDDYAASGPYAGLGFAIGFQNFDTFGIPFEFDPAYGFDAWGGYRFHPHFAAELQLEYLSGFDLTNAPPFQASAQGVAFTANLKAYLLTGRWQPFALVGVGLLWNEVKSNFTPTVDSTDFAARFGGGLDFYLTENIALDVNAAYILPTGGLTGNDYVSLVIGAQYRF